MASFPLPYSFILIVIPSHFIFLIPFILTRRRLICFDCFFLVLFFFSDFLVSDFSTLLLACVAAGPRTRLNHLYSPYALYRRFRASAMQANSYQLVTLLKHGSSYRG